MIVNGRGGVGAAAVGGIRVFAAAVPIGSIGVSGMGDKWSEAAGGSSTEDMNGNSKYNGKSEDGKGGIGEGSSGNCSGSEGAGGAVRVVVAGGVALDSASIGDACGADEASGVVSVVAAAVVECIGGVDNVVGVGGLVVVAVVVSAAGIGGVVANVVDVGSIIRIAIVVAAVGDGVSIDSADSGDEGSSGDGAGGIVRVAVAAGAVCGISVVFVEMWGWHGTSRVGADLSAIKVEGGR